jgi:UDP-2-acetamido-3-amino-2,3-dideoxy-glucuronate N-acetyltransferase
MSTASKPDRRYQVFEGLRFPDVGLHEGVYVDDPMEIRAGTRISYLSYILGNVGVCAYVSIGQNMVIGPRMSVWDHCKIQNDISICEGVELETRVFRGPICVFTEVINPRAYVEGNADARHTLARRPTSIGATAAIVCGLSLGSLSLIAAGALVTRDAPAFAMNSGVPASHIV